MRRFKFHPATWVVLKLRCSTALCLLVLPSQQQQYHQRRSLHPYEYERHHTAGSGGFQLVTEEANYHHKKNNDWPLTTITTATTLSTVRRGGDGTTEGLRGRLQRLKSAISSTTSWGPVQTFLNGSKSIVGLFRKSNQKTEMEAAPLNNNKPPSLMIQEEDEESTTATTTATAYYDDVDGNNVEFVIPQGQRWAIANPDTDLSGTWKPIVTPEFQKEYDEYLKGCGTTYVFRQVCLKFCSTTREQISQEDQGRILHMNGKSPAGQWKRSLISSGTDSTTHEYETYHAEFLDPDKEKVKVEAWWEDDGRVHKSILREKPGVCGGEFETLRYLVTQSNDNDDSNDENQVVMLVTESTFKPSEQHLNNRSSRFKPAFVRWKYIKED